MKTRLVFSCESCGTEYDNAEDARECEDRAATAKPSVKVGDIVTAKSGFGWYDGDRKWITNAKVVERGPVDWKVRSGRNKVLGKRKCPNGDSNCFGECCTYSFFYVVTHIEHVAKYHTIRYHLATLAMTGKQGYRSGYTYDEGHYTPRLAKKVPKYVRETSKKLIGQKAHNLL
jgi:hypothetical protein